MLRLAICLAIVAPLLAGCGVSQRGKEMREQAYSRMDRVNAGLLNEQATTAFETGQLDKAMDLADQAVDRFPKGPAHHVLRGRILMERDRLAEAERSLREAIELDEEQANAHYFLGIVFERLSRDDLAHEHFSTASELEPDRLQFLTASIESLMAQGKLNEAEGMIDGRFDDFEHNAALHHLHGQIMVMRGDGQQAVSSYEMASLLAPDDPDLLGELARLRHRENDPAGVLACLDELRRLHGQVPGLDLQLLEARAYSEMGRQADARIAYQRVVDAHPDRLACWREFGLFAWHIEDWRSVGRCGRRLEAAGDNSVRTRLFLAVAAREDGDLDGARSTLQGILVDQPDNTMASTLLAGVCLRQGDSSAAKKAWQVVVKSGPSGADETRVTGVLGTRP
ncbi:MAG: tetratricopeptide repeat protein [Phycisphaerales bacterium]|nr:tetratricopeptide repeat protein [Phycisphaerales bacterium]